MPFWKYVMAFLFGHLIATFLQVEHCDSKTIPFHGFLLSFYTDKHPRRTSVYKIYHFCKPRSSHDYNFCSVPQS